MNGPTSRFQSFDRFLVPLDGSDLAAQALPYAAALANPGADLNLVRVLPPASPIRDRLGPIVVPADAVARWAEETAQRGLGSDAERVRGSGLTVRTTVVVGDPATEILRLAAAEQTDLIVLASHGRGAMGRLAYGSVADRLARHSPVPVLVVRADDESRDEGPISRSMAVLRRLVVPLDGSELALRSIPPARELAMRLGLSIHLITILDPATMASPALAYGAAFSDKLYREMMEEIRRTTEQALARVASDLEEDGVMVSQQVREGPIGDAIAQASFPGDIIVLSSHGRSGVTRWLLGSVAERLLRIAPVPVLLVPAPFRDVDRKRGVTGNTADRMADLLRRDRLRPEELASLLDLDVNLIRTEAFAGRLPAEILDHHIIGIRREDVLALFSAFSVRGAKPGRNTEICLLSHASSAHA